jgi:hypothetical protein
MLYRRTYSLSIPDPCHESWDKMQAMGNGRFCGSCAKTVTDFTGMTENEIAAFLNNKPQHACGRFTTEQLNKKYTVPVSLAVPAHKRLIRYAMSLFLIGGAAKQIKSQSQDTVVVQQDSLPGDSLEMVAEELAPDSLIAGPDSVVGDTNDLVVVIKSDIEPDKWVNVITSIQISGCISAPQDPYFPILPEFRRAFEDTFAKVFKRYRPHPASEDPMVRQEKAPLPVPPANPAHDPKIEAILPAVFSWRGKKQLNNGKQS